MFFLVAFAFNHGESYEADKNRSENETECDSYNWPYYYETKTTWRIWNESFTQIFDLAKY